jgi:beta-lactamase class D
MVDWYKDKDEIVKDAYDKGSENYQMLSPNIQKDLAKACAEEVTTIIMDEIRGRNFSVLIDESRDVSIKEQMTVILRLVLYNCNFVHRFFTVISIIILTHKQMWRVGL